MNRYAILIGSSTFEKDATLTPLRCPENDVDGMHEIVTAAEFGVFTETFVFKNAPHQPVLDQIAETLAAASFEDQVLIYYSGHGRCKRKGQLYLTTPNTEERRLHSTSVPLVLLREMIDDSDCKKVILILDCCYAAAALTKGDMNKTLEEFADGNGIYLLAATTANRTAEEKEGDQYSLFTKHIINGIKSGAAARPGAAYISIGDVYRYVYDKVTAEGQQKPMWDARKAQGEELIIARAVGAYSNTQLRAFKKKINDLDNEDALPDDIIRQARELIATNQQKRDKPLFDLLSRLCEGNLGLWPFQQMWLAQVGQTSSQQEATPPPPKPKPAASEETSETGLPDLYSTHNMPRPTVRNKPTDEPTKTKEMALTPFKFTTVTLNAGGEDVERRTLQARQFVEELAPGIQLEMVEIPDGTFLMGSPKEEANSYDNERPRLEVTVAPFYLGKFTITQAQWRAIAADKSLKVKIDLEPEPSNFKGDDRRPVEQVSWDDSQEFCARLAKKTGRGYRLPSESEWEYACRAGTTTPFAFGETITPEIVNYDGNYPYAEALKGKYRGETIPVGSLGVANAWGLFDMHGNVWEWCEDVWHDSYKGAPSMSSAWTLGGNSDRRVLRGGAWYYYGDLCRSAFRNYHAPDDRNLSIGFRVVVAARTT